MRERDEARAEVEDLRTRTAAQLEIETQARDEARADAARLRAALRLAEGPIAIAASYADQLCETMGMRVHAKDCARILPEIHAALAGEGEAKRCAWTYDETHFAWDSSCGEKWILMDGGPSENEIRFCHGCGKPVEVACEATPEKVRQGGGAMKVYLVVAYAREECEHMSAWASRDAAEREAQRLRHLHEKVKNIPWKHVHSMSDEAQIMRALHRVRVEEMEVRDG